MWTTHITSSWIAGFTVCLSLIVSIGAQNLYVLRQAVQGRHVRACVAWCVCSDALLIAVGVAGMAGMLAHRPGLAHYLTWGGAIFLLVYGLFSLWRMLRGGGQVAGAGAAVPRSLLQVLGSLVALTLLNPHVYLDTVLLMGSIGAREQAGGKWVFVVGAASASLAWFMLLAVAGRRMKHWFAKPMTWRVMDGLTGAMMLVLAWWLASGISAGGAAPVV